MNRKNLRIQLLLFQRSTVALKTCIGWHTSLWSQ